MTIVSAAPAGGDVPARAKSARKAASTTTPMKKAASTKKAPGMKKAKATKPTIVPNSEEALELVRSIGANAGREAWEELAGQVGRPSKLAACPTWRENQLAWRLENMAGLRPMTHRETAAYACSWIEALEVRIQRVEEEMQARPAVAKFNEPSTPAELSKVIRHFLLEAFDVAHYGGDLITRSDFEVGIGATSAEMTVAVISQGAWYHCKDAINAAIKKDLDL